MDLDDQKIWRASGNKNPPHLEAKTRADDDRIRAAAPKKSSRDDALIHAAAQHAAQSRRR